MGLEIVELVMRLEEEFNLDIPDEDAEKLTTVGETTDYLARRLGIPARDMDALLSRVCLIIEDELDILANKLARDTRYVEDLNLG